MDFEITTLRLSHRKMKNMDSKKMSKLVLE
jgi:hypothetical protein